MIKQKAEFEHSSLSLLGEDFFISNQELYSFVYEELEPIAYKIGMVGKHQQHNAALALKATTLLEERVGQSISRRAKQVGINKATWPGRLERVAKVPPLLLDGAHNQEGFVALAQALKVHFPGKSMHMFIGSTVEKDMSWLVDAMAEADLLTTYYFTTFDFHRAAKPEDLYRQAITMYKKSEPDWREAIPRIYQSLTKDEVLVVTGSLYFISEVRAYLQKNFRMTLKVSDRRQNTSEILSQRYFRLNLELVIASSSIYIGDA
ncbi:cyanophycin synthetase [Bacillus sp. JCM 19041]|uniref:glutamate ligase domain-containing protein n=1 Tax=Bacillus sp. JCM 19041 TaxID=1460637 RepID=UPI00336A2FBF